MIFEAGNETREKIWSDIGAEQKWRAERKEWFLLISFVKKKFQASEIFCSRAAF